MKNVFLDMIEFIDTDPRSTRGTTSSGTYKITPKLQYIKHSTPMPAETVNGLSVLDLGCCVGGTGAWVLANGASNYVGVEIEESYCRVARENLQKYFSDKSWTIINQSVNDFLESNTVKYDLIIAFGIIYTSIELPTTVKKLANITNQKLILDCILPLTSSSVELLEFVDCTLMGNRAQPGRPVKSARATLPFVTTLLSAENFILEADHTATLGNLLKNEYHNRFCATFVPAVADKLLSYEDHYKHNPAWLSGESWKFDRQIADDFVNHAKHHIPGYDRVINKTIDICKILLTPFNNQYRIIDV